MLVALTLVMMAVVGYALLREGIFTAFVMLVNVVLAGLVTFNFWEPVADELDGMFADTPLLHGYEDALAMVALFCLTLGALRWVTNNLASMELEFPLPVLRGGGVAVGLVTGYLLAGFMICVFQTLPWHEQFMGFQPGIDPDKPVAPLRRVLPPDRVWLSMMRRASMAGLADGSGEDWRGFNDNASFELRYARYRRYNDQRDPLPYQGECEMKPEL